MGIALDDGKDAAPLALPVLSLLALLPPVGVSDWLSLESVLDARVAVCARSVPPVAVGLYDEAKENEEEDDAEATEGFAAIGVSGSAPIAEVVVAAVAAGAVAAPSSTASGSAGYTSPAVSWKQRLLTMDPVQQRTIPAGVV